MEKDKNQEIEDLESVEVPGNNGEEDNKFSMVSKSIATKKISIVALVVAALILLYFVFFWGNTGKKKPEIDKDKIKKEAAQVTPALEVPLSQPLYKLPDVPALIAPKPPAPPPAPIIMAPKEAKSTLPLIDDSARKRREMLEARRKASIMVTGGGGGKEGDKDTGKEGDKDDKDKPKKSQSQLESFLGFGSTDNQGTRLSPTASAQVKATKLGRTDMMIAQGKVIDAVLETAINTDLPGMLRAIVTRDIYAESGKNILIEKGSRVVGHYDQDVKAGQTRVYILWERIIKPNGIDIAVDSAGTDTLGRAGIQGDVDTKFWTKIGSALLISYVIPKLAAKVTNTPDGAITQTTTQVGGATSTSVTGQASTLALQQSTSDFSDIATQAIKDTFTTKPTITIDQGSRITILVQKDLVFPNAAVNPNGVIQ